MGSFVIALINNVIWAFFDIYRKKIVEHISPFEGLSIHLYFVPLGLITIGISYYLNPSIITDNWMLFGGHIIGFAFMVMINNYMAFKILQNINISSFFKLILGFMVIFSLLYDYLFLKVLPSFITLTAGILFFISGFMLNSGGKVKGINPSLIGMLIAFGVGGATSALIMKSFTSIAQNQIVSIFILQTFTQLVIGLFGISNLVKVHKVKEIQFKKYIYVLLIFSGVIFEFFMYKGLSIFLIAAVANVKFMIYLLFDYFNGELKLNLILWLGIIIGFIGIFLLLLNNYGNF